MGTALRDKLFFGSGLIVPSFTAQASVLGEGQMSGQSLPDSAPQRPQRRSDPKQRAHNSALSLPGSSPRPTARPAGLRSPASPSSQCGLCRKCLHASHHSFSGIAGGTTMPKTVRNPLRLLVQDRDHQAGFLKVCSHHSCSKIEPHQTWRWALRCRVSQVLQDLAGHNRSV